MIPIGKKNRDVKNSKSFKINQNAADAKSTLASRESIQSEPNPNSKASGKSYGKANNLGII